MHLPFGHKKNLCHHYVIAIVHGTYSATLGAKLQIYLYLDGVDHYNTNSVCRTFELSLPNIYDVDFLVHFTQGMGLAGMIIHSY